MDESALKDKLARTLGLFITGERFMAIWELLAEEGNLPSGDDDENGWETAIYEAERLMRFDEKRGVKVRRDRGQKQEITPTLEAAEGRRAEALMLYWAKQAAGESEVRQFRERVLKDRSLSWEEAYAFLESPLLQVFPQEEIERAGIPLVGHTAVWKRRDSVAVNEGFRWFHWHIEVEAGPPTTVLSYNRVIERLGHLSYPGVQRWRTDANFWPQSVIHDLHSASEAIAKKYEWNEGQAPLFILTDHVPYVPALSYTIRESGYGQKLVTIEVQPWVSRKTVGRAYQQAQEKVYGIVPGPISERNASVFMFVIERVSPRHERPSYRSLMDEWNKHYRARPDWHYEDVRTFERDFSRAEASLLQPKFRQRPSKAFEDMTPAEQIVEKLREYSDSQSDSQEER